MGAVTSAPRTTLPKLPPRIGKIDDMMSENKNKILTILFYSS
jgi:hypothetical protein